MKGGKPPPWEMVRVQVCERMGWTFADFDATDLTDLQALLAVWDGMEKAKPQGKRK